MIYFLFGLQHITLENVDLSNVNFEDANFQSSTLIDANFTNCNFIAAALHGINLSEVKLKGVLVSYQTLNYFQDRIRILNEKYKMVDSDKKQKIIRSSTNLY